MKKKKWVDDFRHTSVHGSGCRLIRLACSPTVGVFQGSRSVTVPIDLIVAFVERLQETQAAEVADRGGAEKAPRGVTGEGDT